MTMVDISQFKSLDRHAMAALASHFLGIGEALKKEADRRKKTAARRSERRARLATMPQEVYQLVESMLPQLGSIEAATEHAASLLSITPEAAALFYRKGRKRHQCAARAQRDATIRRAYRNGDGTCRDIGKKHGLSESYVARLVKKLA